MTPLELFDSHMELALRISSQFAGRLGRDMVSQMPGQIRQAALIGLWNAAQRFNKKNRSKATFKTFAGYHITGAIQDELRKHDFFGDSRRWDRYQKQHVVSGEGTDTLPGVLSMMPGAVKEPALDQQDEVEHLISLADRELGRRLLQLHYVDGLTLQEISKVLKVCSSRITHIHTRAIASIRYRLENNFQKVIDKPETLG